MSTDEAREPTLSALMMAIYHRQSEEVARLIAAGAAPNAFEASALGDRERVASALEDRPDLLHDRAPDGFTLLHLACFFGHADLVTDLIARGIDVNAVADNPSAVTPIHSASANNSTQIVTLLLAAKAAANAIQAGGYTPLLSAALHGNVDMAKALLAAGADPTHAASDGRTAIDMAKEGNHNAIISLLTSS